VLCFGKAKNSTHTRRKKRRPCFDYTIPYETPYGGGGLREDCLKNTVILLQRNTKLAQNHGGGLFRFNLSPKMQLTEPIPKLKEG
jgi:hypothetical protein